MRTTPRIALAAGLLGGLPGLLLAARAGAHSSTDVRIAAIEQRLAADPADARLYLARGELHREAGEPRRALADYRRALALDRKLFAAELGRALVQLEAGDLAGALAAVNRFLSVEPENPAGRVTKARILVRLGRRLEAAGDYGRAIDATPAPKPDWYLERARALAAAGRLEAAIQGLDEGLAKLGPAVSLELGALALERRGRRYDAAIVRLDRLAAGSPRQEEWLFRRGEVLAEAGRSSEARAAYGAALAAIAALPPHRQTTAATTRLEDTLCRRLAGDSPRSRDTP